MKINILLLLMCLITLSSFNTEGVHSVSWYGKPFHGKTTATGKIYDMNKLSCATTWNSETRKLGYPFGTILKITNIRNGKTVDVVVNDTGSFSKFGRRLDLSRAAFDSIANLDKGVINVRIAVVKSVRRKKLIKK